VGLTKEYAAAFSALAIREHEIPGDEILSDYQKFRDWWVKYSKDPEMGDDPYKNYSHGFSVKR
jgi:hypothetical protein